MKILLLSFKSLLPKAVRPIQLLRLDTDLYALIDNITVTYVHWCALFELVWVTGYAYMSDSPMNMVSHTFCVTQSTASISNHMPSNVWDEITYPFPNLDGCIIELIEWISYFVSHYTMDVRLLIHAGIQFKPCQ